MMIMADCLENGFCSQCYFFILNHTSVFAESGRFTSKILGVLIHRVGAVYKQLLTEASSYLLLLPLPSHLILAPRQGLAVIMGLRAPGRPGWRPVLGSGSLIPRKSSLKVLAFVS